MISAWVLSGHRLMPGQRCQARRLTKSAAPGRPAGMSTPPAIGPRLLAPHSLGCRRLPLAPGPRQDRLGYQTPQLTEITLLLLVFFDVRFILPKHNLADRGKHLHAGAPMWQTWLASLAYHSTIGVDWQVPACG
ncbi:uncharacterized protein B0T23DRAFT_370308 [Neurospora hispaniola]|uniref:Uncharacterized protein n=1 Tax=Neurospora hispaniola TaxID=588809 RepID=A0AAJ0IFT6_9PEZI|nr:hypothetical protein B0T23DRAFT_370308 [Neurospora hispaniola]